MIYSLHWPRLRMAQMAKPQHRLQNMQFYSMSGALTGGIDMGAPTQHLGFLAPSKFDGSDDTFDDREPKFESHPTFVEPKV